MTGSVTALHAPTRADILVVAATDRELVSASGWRMARCGVGPVDAAAATAAALAHWRPRAVVHVGIAGARRTSGIAPTSVVIGLESFYCDLGVSPKWAPNVLAPNASLLAAMQHALSNARTLRIGTSARIGGSHECDVEAMEGFAVLRAAQLADIPAIEVRVISNEIEESDRARWHFDDAFALLASITPTLVDAAVRGLGADFRV